MKIYSLNKESIRKEIPELYLKYFGITDPKQIQLFNYIKSLNLKMTCYHGTSAFVYSKIKETGYLLSPIIMGTSDQEGRGESTTLDSVSKDHISNKGFEKKKGLNQIFLTTNIGYAVEYAERTTSQINNGFTSPKGKTVEPAKDYKLKEKIDEDKDYEVILELEIPVHLIQEIVVPIINSDEIKKIYNEFDTFDWDNFYKTDLSDLKGIIEEYLNKYKENESDNEFTVQMLLPTKYITNAYDYRIAKLVINDETEEDVKIDPNNEKQFINSFELLLKMDIKNFLNIITNFTDFYNKNYDKFKKYEDIFVKKAQPTIINNIAYFSYFKNNFPEFFYRYKDVLEKAMVKGLGKIIESNLSYVKTIINEHTKDHSDLLIKYKKEFDEYILVGIKNLLNKYVYKYPELLNEYPEIFSKNIDELGQFEGKWAADMSSKIAHDSSLLISHDGINNIKNKYPELFNKYRTQFEGALLVFIEHAISVNPNHLTIFKKQYPDIVAKYPRVFETYEEMLVRLLEKTLKTYTRKLNFYLEIQGSDPELFKKHRDRLEQAAVIGWEQDMERSMQTETPRYIYNFIKTQYYEEFAKYKDRLDKALAIGEQEEIDRNQYIAQERLKKQPVRVPLTQQTKKAKTSNWYSVFNKI